MMPSPPGVMLWWQTAGDLADCPDGCSDRMLRRHVDWMGDRDARAGDVVANDHTLWRIRARRKKDSCRAAPRTPPRSADSTSQRPAWRQATPKTDCAQVLCVGSAGSSLF